MLACGVAATRLFCRVRLLSTPLLGPVQLQPSCASAAQPTLTLMVAVLVTVSSRWRRTAVVLRIGGTGPAGVREYCWQLLRRCAGSFDTQQS
jgi:hypothetical protein